MRVSQGRHDVPSEKLQSRLPRTLQNLRLAVRELPYVVVFDNENLASPFIEAGRVVWQAEAVPDALQTLLPRQV